jgi:hypothetical protein
MTGWVYFIQVEENGPIKIGYTSLEVSIRLATLQSANHQELRLLGFIMGDRVLESELQGQCADARIRGEWFWPTVAVRALVAERVAGGTRSVMERLLAESVVEPLMGPWEVGWVDLSVESTDATGESEGSPFDGLVD